MVLIIPNGRIHGLKQVVRIGTILLFALIFSISATAQINCSAGGGTPTVHAEGLAEKIGNVTLSCNGGTPGAAVNTIVYVGIGATITNRLDTNNNPTGISVTIDTGAGAVPQTLTPQLTAAGTLLFNPLKYTIPANAAQNVNIVISGIRVAVPTASQNLNGFPVVTGTIAATGLNIANSPPFLALSGTSLLSSTLNYGVPCAGSPLPATLDFPTFISTGTGSSTVRLTEGFNSSFLPKDPTADTGVRLLVKLSGYPSGTRVFVPDAIVGNRGTIPTTAGAFNSTPNGGSYTPNSSQLLLSRVNGADATGNGGTLAVPLPTGVTSFTSVTELTLSSGAATVTYEVLDSNPSLLDTAQLPFFVVAPATTCSTTPVLTFSAMVAPVSTVAVPTTTDPIPRFIATPAGSDCTVLGDCSASYFPQLQVTPTSVTLNGSSLGSVQSGFIQVGNGGASEMPFTVTTTYQTASGLSPGNWLTVSPTTSVVLAAQGVNNTVSVMLQANPGALTVPGSYQASVVINAGSAGTITVPVTFTVSAAGPVIQGVVNSANFQPGPVTANSFVSIFGLNLVKKNSLTVTFDGFSAPVFFDGTVGTSSQINTQVPASVGSISNVGVIVTVDGLASNTFALSLVPNAPAVFNPGIENQDYSVNSASQPAALDDIVQVFMTGMATPVTGSVTVTIGGLANLTPIYAGPVTSIPGLEQVNVRVPSNLQFANGSAPLSVCVPGTLGAPVCSPSVPVYLH